MRIGVFLNIVYRAPSLVAVPPVEMEKFVCIIVTIADKSMSPDIFISVFFKLKSPIQNGAAFCNFCFYLGFP